MQRIYLLGFYGVMLSLLASCRTTPPPVEPPIIGQTQQRLEKNLTHPLALDYLLFLPESYNEDPDRSWPIILFLHGAGERGDNLDHVTKHGPPKIVKDRQYFPFIVVSPQCPEGQVWENEILITLLDEVMRKYRVDSRRVYLTGLSMGGYGTWSLGLEYPDRFAALAPICGGGNTLRIKLPDPDKRAALLSLPIWAFHGAKDQVVPLEESKRMVEALKQAGVEDAKLYVFPEAGHDAWTETYGSDKLYDWFLQHRR